MAALGFSVNMLTLFGLVLAIGIVVDDAIVIVENAVHHIDRGQAATAARRRSRRCRKSSGRSSASRWCLMAVFLPTAFLGGIIGQLYRQFALTIAATALISAINAVTLKPAQCALYLRPTPRGETCSSAQFNAVYDRCESAYAVLIGRAVRHVGLMLCLFTALSVLTAWWFTRLPTGFLPPGGPGIRHRRHPASRRGVAGEDAQLSSRASARSSKRCRASRAGS